MFVVQFVQVDDDVLVLRVFVAFDDLVVGYRSMHRTALVVFNTAVAPSVELVQARGVAVSRRSECFHRDRDETEVKESLPGSWRHESRWGSEAK